MGKGSFKYMKVGNIWRLSMNNIHWYLPAYLWTYQRLLAITDAPRSRGFIRTHNYRDINCAVDDCCRLLMSLEIVSQRTSTSMCVLHTGFETTDCYRGKKKTTTIPLQPEDIKKIIIYNGKTGLTPDTILCNFLLELWQYAGVKCGYTRFFPWLSLAA